MAAKHRVNGLEVYEAGVSSGLPVVFIHGFPFTHAMWSGQVELLSGNYRVITYDIRGHGESEAGDGLYSIEFFVDDLIAILDSLKINQAVLCGLSMGGYIALRAVERHPERLRGLILCDTKSEADENDAKIKRAASIKAVKKDGVAKFAESFVKAVLAESTLRSSPKVVSFVKDMIKANTVVGIAGTLLALASRTDTTASLAAIKVPTLILVGAEDKVTPPAASQSMAKAVPNAKIHLVPSSAHLSNLENPAVFNEKLSAFLAGIR